MELMKAVQIQNVAEKDGLEVAPARARSGSGGRGKGTVATMKVVVRKHELKQALELIMRSPGGAGRGGGKISVPAAKAQPLLGLSAEQRLNVLWRRKFAKCSSAARGLGGRSCPWRPTLQSIPEE